MADFQPALSDEMMDQLVVEVYEYVKKGVLSEMKVRGVSNALIKQLDDDGELMFYDIRYEGEKRPIHIDTMTGRVRIIVKDWKKYLGPLMLPHMIEATYEHVTKAKDSTASFKIAADAIMPEKKESNEDPFALSPGAQALLQRKRVAAVVIIGQDGTVEAVGDGRHECVDSVHPLADGQQEDTPAEVVSSGDDRTVHGLHERGDTAQRPIIPDTEMAPEDSVDNDSRANLVSAERS